jgi:hypothetical protein
LTAFLAGFRAGTVFAAGFTSVFLVETVFLTVFLITFFTGAAFTVFFFPAGAFFEAAEAVFLDDDGFFTVLDRVLAVIFLPDEAATFRTGFTGVFDEVFDAGLAVFLVISPPKTYVKFIFGL